MHGGEQTVLMMLGLGTLLAVARILGELACSLRLPTVLGEILAGILLGPTLLGAWSPRVMSALFPASGPGASALQAFAKVGVVAFLLVAGLEMDLSFIRSQVPRAMAVSVGGIALPFMLGFAAARTWPGLFARPADADGVRFALLFGAAMSISALPVIARTLMDLSLYRTKLGTTIMAAATVDDVAGWLLFAMIFGLGDATARSAGSLVALTALFVALAFLVLLIGGRRVLPWLEARGSRRGSVLGLTFAFVLLAAGAAEWIGVHAAFGALVAGVALSASQRFPAAARAALTDVTHSLLAPLFFASIGLRVDFAAQFRWQLLMGVLAVSFAGKIIGCATADRVSGSAWREALAVGFGMNSRGAMEIVFGVLALERGLITQPLFVALVVMALTTSLVSGPAMMYLLGRARAAEAQSPPDPRAAHPARSAEPPCASPES